VLSRGYKRKTTGFVPATKRSTPTDIGDEPYQIYQKFGDEVRVAVCEKRTKGIDEMLRIDPSINLIVLDDAFQHRYVKPSLSVILMEWNKPIYNDDLLPLGRLREQPNALLRSDIVIVTKCPMDVNPVDVRMVYDYLGLFPYHRVYFSRYVYGNLVSVFPDDVTYVPNLSWLKEYDSVLVVAGIANPNPLIRYVKSVGSDVNVKLKRFPDHHNFTRRDFDEVLNLYNHLPGKSKYIVTTEKDAVRIANNPYYPHELKSKTFYLPINVEFLPNKWPQSSNVFDREIKTRLTTQAIN
jgi:tetraacyldisaccharide 4'-kinase